MSEIMLLGVLRMPFEIALSTELARRQYWQRGKQAAAEIERLHDEVERLKGEVERLTTERVEMEARCARLVEIADSYAYAAGLATRRMEEAQEAQRVRRRTSRLATEAKAEVEQMPKEPA